MNPVLERILRTKIVSNGKDEQPLRGWMDEAECDLIRRAIESCDAKVGIEVGLAHGTSALCAIDAMKAKHEDAQHHVIDPQQTTGTWEGIGVRNLQEAGFKSNYTLIERGSEVALPELYDKGLRVDVAIIDGVHTLDHTMIDFFYINRMLKVGGVVIIDDANWPGVNKALRYFAGYPCYRIFDSANVSEEARPIIDRLLNQESNSDVDWGDIDGGIFGSATCLKKIDADRRKWDYWREF